MSLDGDGNVDMAARALTVALAVGQRASGQVAVAVAVKVHVQDHVHVKPWDRVRRRVEARRRSQLPRFTQQLLAAGLNQ